MIAIDDRRAAELAGAISQIRWREHSGSDDEAMLAAVDEHVGGTTTAQDWQRATIEEESYDRRDRMRPQWGRITIGDRQWVLELEEDADCDGERYFDCSTWVVVMEGRA